MTAEEQSAIRQFLQDEAQASNQAVRDNQQIQQKMAKKREAALQRSRKQNKKPATNVSTTVREEIAKEKRLAAAVARGESSERLEAAIKGGESSRRNY